MTKQVEVNGKTYTFSNITGFRADIEVTKNGNFIKSFYIQVIGSPANPEPDFSGVACLDKDDIKAIESTMPAYPTAELYEYL